MTMKRRALLFITVLTATVVSLTACQEEEKQVIETMTSGFMTGYTNHDGLMYKLKDDFGNLYNLNEKRGFFTPDSTYRLLASIVLKDNGSASILQLVGIPSENAPEDSVLEDSVKVKDPLKVYTAYIGGGYLNITLGIKVEKEHTIHRLRYSHKEDSLSTTFLLYHNAYGDGQVYTKNAYVSIPLTKYALTKNDTVSIIYNGYDGDSIMTLVYR